MEKVVQYCTDVMLKQDVIDKGQRERMLYGLDLLFSSILSLLSFTILGMMLGKGAETFWLLAVMIPMQSFGGGYHCQTHFRCWLLMVISMGVALYGLVQFPQWMLWCATLAASGAIFGLAPIEHPDAPFGEVFRQKMKRVVRGVYLMALIAAAASEYLRIGYPNIILAAVLLSGISITSAKIKQVYKTL